MGTQESSSEDTRAGIPAVTLRNWAEDTQVGTPVGIPAVTRTRPARASCAPCTTIRASGPT